jgi:hypothetical protein
VPALAGWGVAAVARVLGALRGLPVSRDEVRDRAVGLGLLRLSGPGDAHLLTPMAVARLFLAGYRLPATVDVGTLASLGEHQRAGRRVFLLLSAVTAWGRRERRRVSAECVVEAHALLPEAHPKAHLLLSEPRPGEPSLWRLSLASFNRSWAAAGRGVLIAESRWEDLPDEGSSFFAGCRSRDGTYHWHTAECDTDGAGHVLRY